MFTSCLGAVRFFSKYVVCCMKIGLPTEEKTGMAYFLLCCSEGGRTALSEINWRKKDVGFQGWAGRLADGVLQIPALCFQLSLLGKEASCCHKTLLTILLTQGSLTSTLFLNVNLSQSVWRSYQYTPIKGHRLECWSLKVRFKVGYCFIVEGRERRCVLQVCFSSLL